LTCSSYFRKVASKDEEEDEDGALPPAPSPLPDIAVKSRKNDGESGGSMDGDVEDCERVES